MKKSERNKKVVLNIIFGTLLIGVLALSVFSLARVSNLEKEVSGNDIFNGEWSCLMERCLDWMTETEWIEANCFGSDNGTVCNVEFEGSTIQAPITDIDTSQINICEHSECATEIYVKQINSGSGGKTKT